MNIGERFYCSVCLVRLPDEMICPACGHDPSAVPEPDVLEEGTLLGGIQYQLGAVKNKTKNSIIYGAFDYIRQQMLFIGEYYPSDLAVRDKNRDGGVIVPAEYEERFEKGKRKFIGLASKYGEVFEENHTAYLVFLPDDPNTD